MWMFNTLISTCNLIWGFRRGIKSIRFIMKSAENCETEYMDIIQN